MLAPGVRRSADGRTLIGGSPLRVLRLSERAAAALDGGAPPGRLARRLLDAGMANPRPGAAEHGMADVDLVIPVRDAPVPAVQSGYASVTVVDDASQRPVDAPPGVDVIRHDAPAGPAAARNTGWRRGRAPYVAFVDADCAPPSDWVGRLLPQFTDAAVAAVAPRVVSAPGTTVLSRYELARSPLDLGPAESRVAPGTRVPYVPSAALVVRRRDLEELGGFDPALRFGEDVDLVWRLVEAGRTVRYVPDVAVEHQPRRSWWGLVRQRIGYGRSAAALDRRHPGQLPPVDVNVWSAVSWGLVVGGRPGVGAAAAVASAAGLVPRLRGVVDDPLAEAARLGLLGHLWAGRWLGLAVTRAWLPVALVASRRAVVAAVLLPSVVEWLRDRPPLDPARWVAARLVDDASYCAGLWLGCLAEGTAGPLRPRLRALPVFGKRANLSRIRGMDT